MSRNRLHLSIDSEDLLNVNITSTLTELYQQVRDSWVQDYYSEGDTLQSNEPNAPSPSAYRQRSPFVPYALKNDTGIPLHFTTFIIDTKYSFQNDVPLEVTDKWMLVAPGETVPFSFTAHSE